MPQAWGDLAATQAAYEFWSSPHIKAQAIREAHQKSTIERVKTLRTSTLELQPPQTYPERECLEPVSLQVILAVEDNPPSGVEPVCWLLLTTLAVSCFDDVVKCLRWYSYRWLIERYHYVLKSGCRLEQLQLETSDSEASKAKRRSHPQGFGYLHDRGMALIVDYLPGTLSP